MANIAKIVPSASLSSVACKQSTTVFIDSPTVTGLSGKQALNSLGGGYSNSTMFSALT